MKYSILIFSTLLCISDLFSQIKSTTKFNIKLEIVNHINDSLLRYPSTPKVLYFSVLQYNNKTIDVQVIPKNVYMKNYDLIDLTHFVKYDNFSTKDQLILFERYKDGVGALDKEKMFVFQLININNISHFSDDLKLDTTIEKESFFSLDHGTIPKFLNHIIIRCEFNSIKNNVDLFKHIFPNGIQLSEVYSDCKNFSCKLPNENRTVYLSLLKHNNANKIIDANSIFDDPVYAFEFDPRIESKISFVTSHYIPQTEFSDDEKLVLFRSACEYGDNFHIKIFNNFNSHLKDYSWEMCRKELPSFLSRILYKLKY